MDQGTLKVILFFNSSLGINKNKEYLSAVFIDISHVKNFFQNILLKTAWLCDVRLHNYDAINFVLFFRPPCSFRNRKLFHKYDGGHPEQGR